MNRKSLIALFFFFFLSLPFPHSIPPFFVSTLQAQNRIFGNLSVPQFQNLTLCVLYKNGSLNTNATCDKGNRSRCHHRSCGLCHSDCCLFGYQKEKGQRLH